MKVISLNDARAAGLKVYFTGKPCAHGHIAERLVRDRACSICRRETHSKYRRANPEKVKAWKRKYHVSHPEGHKIRARNWYLANVEKTNAISRAWKKRNPHVQVATEARRRGRKVSCTPAWADHVAIGMIYRAAEVIRTTGFDVHVDHVVPLQGKRVSGFHVHNNLEIISARENMLKSNRF